jgi:hypothetical protein
MALYARSNPADISATPLLDADGRLYYAVALFVAVGYGLAVERAGEDDDLGAPGWILPALTLLGAFLLAGVYHSWPVVVAVPLLAGSGVFAALVVRHYLIAEDVETLASARLTHLVLTLSVVLVNFAMLGIHRAGPAYSAVTLGTVGGLAAYQLFDVTRATEVRRTVYAVAIGFGLAEVAWALEFWNARGWYAAALLSTVFFALARLADARVRAELTRPFVYQNVGLAAALFAVFAFLAE